MQLNNSYELLQIIQREMTQTYVKKVTKVIADKASLYS